MLHVQDHSMLAHDARAIPLPPLRRMHRAPTRHTVIHLVRSPDVNLSATNLIFIARTDPCSIPLIVSAIRRYLLPTRTRRIHDVCHPLQLLYKLVLCVPYFYRYIASPAFFRQFWRLNMDAAVPSSTPSAPLLLAAWARDLRKMARRNDPAATFWYVTARNMCKQQRLPRVPHSSFVYPVTSNILTRIAAPLTFLNHDETKRTLRLMNQMTDGSNGRWRRASRFISSLSSSSSISRLSSTSMCVHNPNTQQCVSIPTPAPPARKACQELSDKFLAVKKRHDQVACMRSRNADELLLSDASLATIGAASYSSGALRLSEKMRLCCDGGNCCICKNDEYFLDEKHGITPSSFADLFVDDAQGDNANVALGEREGWKMERQVLEAVESVGNTVKLPSNVDLEALHAKFRQAAAAAKAKKRSRNISALRSSRRASSILDSGRYQ